MSLGQLATDEKSNEITAIPELIDSIEIQGAVITIDAAGCQRAIAAKIIAAKIFAAKIIQGNGDYVLALKGNQGNLHDAVIKYFETHRENNFADIHVRTHVETLKGHGRVDEITYYQMAVPGDFVNRDKWAGLKTIGVAIRQSTSGAKSTTEVRFYISSLAMGVQQLARFIRGHWAIVNSLHWCLDVTFREDECRVRQRTADGGQQSRLAQTLRTKPTQTTKRQIQHRHAAKSRWLEPRLLGASTWYTNALVCVCRGGEERSLLHDKRTQPHSKRISHVYGVSGSGRVTKAVGRP